MRFVLIILLVQSLYSQNIHRGCMKENHSRSSRPDHLTQTHLSQSEHFIIHYDTPDGDDAPVQTDLDSNEIPDYIEQVAAIADSTRQILTEVMGFRQEIDDEDGKYDIYIIDQFNAYGYNHPDYGDGITGSSWIEIDNDYAESSYYTNGIKVIRNNHPDLSLSCNLLTVTAIVGINMPNVKIN